MHKIKAGRKMLRNRTIIRAKEPVISRRFFLFAPVCMMNSKEVSTLKEPLFL